MSDEPMPPIISTLTSTLRSYYGPPPAPPTTDPFELVLFEQVAYLANDATRRAAFDGLRTRVGLSPVDIRDADETLLRAVCRMGGSIAVEDRANRMRASAKLVLSQFAGQATDLLALPEPQARRALRQFDMIGEPGADRILAIAGRTARVPLDSNALRVLERLNVIAASKNYSAQYRAAQLALAESEATERVDLGALLTMHGQQLCKRSAPHCAPCPLRQSCPSSSTAW